MQKHPVWQLHEAKARFSELFRLVRTQGPQRVVKQHGEAVVIVPAEDFDGAVEKGRQPDSLLEFFQSAPTGGLVLDLKRKRDKTRKIRSLSVDPVGEEGPASQPERLIRRLRR